jgi:hypothetical protein
VHHLRADRAEHEPADGPERARSDHDQFGVERLTGREDLVGGIADRRVAGRGDARARERVASRVQNLPLLLLVPVGRDIRRAGAKRLVVARDLDQVAAGVVEHCCRDRAHRDGLLGESHSESAKALELQVDVVDGERCEAASASGR